MSNENKEMTMKKMYLILGLALGMLTAACSTDLTNDVLPTPENEVVLGVSIEDAARTQLGSLNGTEYPVLWSAGDKIWVNGKTSNEVAAADAGAKAAKFTVSDVTAPYHIVYPAEVVVEDNSLAVNNMVVINVPVDQEYTKGSFADKTAVMACYAEGAAVTMKHLYGFVKLTIAKGDDVALKSVLLEAVDGTPIAGDLLVKISKEECTIANHAGVNYIHVSGANGIPYEGGKAEVIVQCTADSALPDLDTTNDGITANNDNWDGSTVPDKYDFCFAWMTDTQYYVQKYQHHFLNMNNWIVNNRDITPLLMPRTFWPIPPTSG